MSERLESDDLQRLSRISTCWTVIAGQDADSSQAWRSRQSLLHRYRGAVYRYLLGATRDPDLAEELCQEFAVKVLSGKFNRAQRTKGRFRDYLKTALINLVRDQRDRRAKAPGSIHVEIADAQVMHHEESRFDVEWRDEVLEQTWRALESDRPTHYRVLRMRVDAPDLTSREIAAACGGILGKPMTAANVRKILQRAQKHFADALVSEVAKSVEAPTVTLVRMELEQLDLLQYCGSALERWAHA